MASAGGAAQEPDIFEIGNVIDDQYVISARLGKGGYGEIYRATSIKDGSVVAVKVERATKSGNLFEELSILNTLAKNGCKHIPTVLSSGFHESHIHYITMELLGDNLSLLRRRQETHALSLKTTCALAMQMLKGVKQVHDHGYLHRDIKPGNFVMGGSKDSRSVYIIDYGLSRRYIRPDGSLRPKRGETRWVGSRRYMSPNTHLRKDQGRRDDMWGFLYVVIELYTGTLPWAHLRGIQNLDKVRDIKLEYRDERLVQELPAEFLRILEHIQSLKWADRPNYRLIHHLLNTMYIREGGQANTPYDWEIPRAVSQARLSFSSVHSSNGFSDGEPIGEGEGSASGGEKPRRPAATPVRRFHGLEDSADFSEDSSARRRKRQQTALSQHEQARTAQTAAATTTALDTPATADSQAPKKKKKKRRCVIQ